MRFAPRHSVSSLIIGLIGALACVDVACIPIFTSRGIRGVGQSDWRESLKYYVKGDHERHGEMLSEGIRECESDGKQFFAETINLANYNLLHLQRGLYRQHKGDLSGARDDFRVAYANSEIEKSFEFDQTEKFLRYKGADPFELGRGEQYFLHFYMGLNQLIEGDYAHALIEARKTAWIDEDADALPEINFLRAVILYHLGHYEEAAIQARRCIVADPDFGSAYLLMAKIFKKKPELADGERGPQAMLSRYEKLTEQGKIESPQQFLLIEMPEAKLDWKAQFVLNTGERTLEVPVKGLTIEVPRSFKKDRKSRDSRYWAFLPEYIAVIPIPEGEAISTVRLPTRRRKWDLVEMAAPVFADSGELGYVALRLQKTQK
jgi:tetratricopeptide (TPR) repeat protein